MKLLNILVVAVATLALACGGASVNVEKTAEAAPAAAAPAAEAAPAEAAPAEAAPAEAAPAEAAPAPEPAPSEG